MRLGALDAGAEDVRESDGGFEVITAPSEMPAIKEALEGLGATIESADVTQLPSTTVPLERETAGKVLRLIDALEDLDDVQDVFANFDIPDEVMTALSE